MKGITVASQRLAPKDVADILGVSLVTVWKYARHGIIKAYRKNNNKLYFLQEDIDEYKSRYEKPIVPIAPINPPITGKSFGLKSFRGYAMKVKDVAALLAVSPRWIEIHLNKGTFPIRWFPVGPRGRVFDSADVEEWLSKIFVRAGSASLPLKRRASIKKEVAVNK